MTGGHWIISKINCVQQMVADNPFMQGLTQRNMTLISSYSISSETI